MKIITLEEHIVTPAYRQAASKLPDLSRMAPNNPDAKAHMQQVQQKLGDLGEQHLADMDAAGIDIQVLSLAGILMDKLDAKTATEIARDANETMARMIQAHPTRFAAFAALNPKEPEEAAHEFRRCVLELGFVGAMIDGMTDGLFLDDPRFTPIFDAAVELGVPIYLHPAPPPESVQQAYYTGLPEGVGQALSIAGWGWHVETGLHALRLIVSGLFDRLPDLQIIIGHMGENLPFSILRAQTVLTHSGLNLSKPISDYFKTNFHVTTSGYFTLPPFECALAILGTERILFSVDYPFSPNEVGVKFLDSLPISSEDKELIAHGNAERLLRLNS